MSADRKYDVAHVVVLENRKLATLTNHDFVTGAAKLFFVVRVKIPATVRPNAHLRIVVIARYSHLWLGKFKGKLTVTVLDILP